MPPAGPSSNPVPGQVAEGRSGGLLIPVGYFFSLLGGLIGVAIGGSLWRAQERDAQGIKSARYDKGTQRHGVAILTLGAVMFAFWTQAGETIQRGLSSLGGGAAPSSSAPASTPAASPLEASAPDPQPAGSSRSRASSGGLPGMNPNPSPGDDLDRALLGQLDETYQETLRSEGFAPAIHRALGRLGERGTEEHNLTLPGDHDVTVVGLCDADCPDLDLVLFDEAGNLIDADTETDAFPLVGFTTDSSVRTYVLRVGMTQCTRGPCYFAFGVFTRSR